LSRMPSQHPGVGPGLSDFAHQIRVQHEVHKDTRRTRSGGRRGGSQSVTPRMESYQAMISFMAGRDLRLRRAANALRLSAGGV
jgi:hypothetical protein